MEENKWSRARNVLCVRPDSMGDLIMTMPAIRALRNALPGRKITLLTSSNAKPLARIYQEIDDLIVYDAAWVSNTVPWESESITALIRLLKEKRFDAAILFTVYSQSPLPAAFVCSMADIPVILAFSRENPYRLISEWIPDPEPLYYIQHEVVRQLSLVSYAGASTDQDELYIPLDKKAIAKAREKLQTIGIDPAKRWLVVHPGVSETRRQFPAASYARAVHLLDEAGWQIVLTGTSKEKELAASIIEKADAHVFSTAGMLDIEELIGLISQSPVLVANNTGVIHIAAALKTPIVGLYATTNPQHYPWKVKHKLLLFDVPEDKRSRNVIIKYAFDKMYNYIRPAITAQDIVKAVQEITSG